MRGYDMIGQNKRDRRNTVEDDMKCWVTEQPII